MLKRVWSAQDDSENTTQYIHDHYASNDIPNWYGRSSNIDGVLKI